MIRAILPARQSPQATRQHGSELAQPTEARPRNKEFLRMFASECPPDDGDQQPRLKAINEQDDTSQRVEIAAVHDCCPLSADQTLEVGVIPTETCVSILRTIDEARHQRVAVDNGNPNPASRPDRPQGRSTGRHTMRIKMEARPEISGITPLHSNLAVHAKLDRLLPAINRSAERAAEGLSSPTEVAAASGDQQSSRRNLLGIEEAVMDKDNSTGSMSHTTDVSSKDIECVTWRGTPVLLPELKTFPSPARQILTVLERPMADLPSTTTAQGETGPVRSLRIALQPETLGPVQVTLRLQGTKLRIEIETAEKDTLRILQQDKPLLDTLVQRISSEQAVGSVAVLIRSTDQPNGDGPSAEQPPARFMEETPTRGDGRGSMQQENNSTPRLTEAGRGGLSEGVSNDEDQAALLRRSDIVVV